MFGSKILLQWQTKINLNFLKNWSSCLWFYKVQPISSFHPWSRDLEPRSLCLATSCALETQPGRHGFAHTTHVNTASLLFLGSVSMVSFALLALSPCNRTVPKDAPRASCRLSSMFYLWATSSGLVFVFSLFLVRNPAGLELTTWTKLVRIPRTCMPLLPSAGTRAHRHHSWSFLDFCCYFLIKILLKPKLPLKSYSDFLSHPPKCRDYKIHHYA